MVEQLGIPATWKTEARGDKFKVSLSNLTGSYLTIKSSGDEAQGQSACLVCKSLFSIPGPANKQSNKRIPGQDSDWLKKVRCLSLSQSTVVKIGAP